MLLVGLTGNYGMGKSTVLEMFKELGASTLDADEIVASLLEEKVVLDKVRRLLGENVFNANGSLNKKKVAEVVFKNNDSRHSLEDILHPLVFERVEDFSDKIKAKEEVLIVAAPLIFEGGCEGRFDRTIVVFTKEESALERLEKKGIPRAEATLRLRAQLPIYEKIKRADFLIDNDGTLEETMEQVKAVHKKLLKEAGDGDNQRP